MKKLIWCGLFLVGIVFCFYPYITDRSKCEMKQCEILKQEGVIGVIEIPAIDVTLPIYDGTEEEILSKGIGRVVESSPFGEGENTHSLLAGHRGLPSAEMFLRLDELKEGDQFSIYVAGKELLYEVCKFEVIRPEETERLQIQEGKELVSLITCTPYGINTHRLVVTGERKICDE